MIFKAIKYTVVGGLAAVLVGGAVFGSDLLSYVRSSTHCFTVAVKDNVPVEFELRRARDLVNEILPEMQANIRAIAEQEVELANLRGEIGQAEQTVTGQRTQLASLRDKLGTAQANFTIGRLVYSRDELKDDLSRRFESLREAELVLAGKQRLLTNREKSLQAAMQLLEKTRTQRATLESQIASLEAQHKLVQVAAVGSTIQVDHSKLAQTQKLIAQIKKQLDVSERVLAHEAKFVDLDPTTEVNEKDLLNDVDAYLAAPAGSNPGVPQLSQATPSPN